MATGPAGAGACLVVVAPSVQAAELMMMWPVSKAQPKMRQTTPPKVLVAMQRRFCRGRHGRTERKASESLAELHFTKAEAPNEGYGMRTRMSPRCL